MRTLRTCLVGLLLLSGVGTGVATAQIVAPPPANCSVDSSPVNCNTLSGQEAALEVWPMPPPAAAATGSAPTPVPRAVLSRARFTG